jgi:hypothetical protein
VNRFINEEDANCLLNCYRNYPLSLSLVEKQSLVTEALIPILSYQALFLHICEVFAHPSSKDPDFDVHFCTRCAAKLHAAQRVQKCTPNLLKPYMYNYIYFYNCLLTPSL